MFNFRERKGNYGILEQKTMCEENEYEQQNEEKEGEGDEMDGIAEKVQCVSLLRPKTSKKGEKLSLAKYGLWRREQKTHAARLQKQLKAQWEFEQLIEEQLNRFRANYNCDMVPTRLKDVAQSLMPKWALPHELAALAWLGDWRPSAILDLLRGLVHSPSTLKGSNDMERLLSQVMNEIRIEEAVIDEEMAEIQATCIFHLSFAPLNKHLSRSAAMTCVQAEFKKIERVITKAQQLRLKALELLVKKVLSQTDAAEFLVAFVGIQDLIHQFATRQKLPKCPGTAPGTIFLHS
ncbi:uncharacterized protein LOC110634832 isoform X2 [Hevea brasiliensis]|uniref:uncharacterized protein LOC110634832 isoform X2 n=1 Tax=Hevea brasiliensis TaxID=3981 RepID=UPI000B7805BC|nr:uncharacterized protein LOC110634832 isoform X2 [Hevea brasiliensis]